MSTEISIVLGSYNRRRFLGLTLESVRANRIDVPYEIVVVDGGSTDGSIEYLTRQKDVITIVQHNRGTWRGREVERRSWGCFMNLAFRAASGRYVCMISDDCLLVPGAAQRGYDECERLRAEGRRIGAMAFWWRNWPDQSDYMVSVAGGTPFVNHGLYTREALEAVDYIDEEAFRFYCADADLCLRMAEKGFECAVAPDSFVEHHSHANRKARASNRALMETDKAAFMERWAERLGASDYDALHTIRRREWTDPADTAAAFRRVRQWDLYSLRRAVRRAIRPRKWLRAALGRERDRT